MTTMKTSLVFMGTPDFALPTLKALHKQFPVRGVITQPDRKSGRGQTVHPPPVKKTARKLKLPILQPDSLAAPETMEQLENWQPDVIVVAAYGKILPPEVLHFPPHGCLNVHASLLPRWRGAAPINAAILHGDEQTGVTIMKMDQGLDTGPILSQEAIPILPDETAGSLFQKLSQLGARLLLDTIPPYLRGDIHPRPQNDHEATYAPQLQREDGKLPFQKPAQQLERRVRAFHPWPGSFLFYQGKRLIVHRAHAEAHSSPGPGVLCTHNEFPAVGTSQGILVLDEVQPAGKRPMPGDSFLRGARDWPASS
jgi:methionyl-tRNA formyltransferase